MKDAVHHLKYVQRKVIQSVRKELSNQQASSPELVKTAATGMENQMGKSPQNSKRYR